MMPSRVGRSDSEKNRLVREVGHIGQSRYCRCSGPGAGRDHGLGKPERFLADVHDVGSGECGVADENIDPEVTKACGRIVRADVGPKSSHPFHDRRKVDDNAAEKGNSEFRGGACIRRRTRCSDQRLGRDAPDVEAIPAEHMPFDQGDTCAQAARTGRRYESGGATTDHHQVVPGGGIRIHPVDGMDVSVEFSVVGVPRQER